VPSVCSALLCSAHSNDYGNEEKRHADSRRKEKRSLVGRCSAMSEVGPRGEKKEAIEIGNSPQRFRDDRNDSIMALWTLNRRHRAGDRRLTLAHKGTSELAAASIGKPNLRRSAQKQMLCSVIKSDAQTHTYCVLYLFENRRRDGMR
jgi:hypothetical protein